MFMMQPCQHPRDILRFFEKQAPAGAILPAQVAMQVAFRKVTEY
jgi:hypothetical protein